jgi:DNA invertase Pin-like site-specific DNA recombinase
MKPLRTVIYGRVSTKTQDPSMQLTELREYAGRRGDLEIIGEFVDLGVSGSRDSRPQLNRVMTLARERKIDAVLVWKLDRWGRSLQHLVASLQELQLLKVQFISYRDGVDPSTASGRMFTHMLGVLAEYERELIRERTVAGLQEARRRGVKLGRRPVTFDVTRARELRSTGISYAAIAKLLGISTGTVHSTLVAG